MCDLKQELTWYVNQNCDKCEQLYNQIHLQLLHSKETRKVKEKPQNWSWCKCSNCIKGIDVCIIYG